MNEVFLERLREVLGSEQCFTQEDMKKHTTFQAGGPAEYYVRPKRSQIQPVLSLCRQYGIPWMVIGNGSNLLAGDKGIPGVVMEIGRMADGIACCPLWPGRRHSRSWLGWNLQQGFQEA